ncbi:MAG: hypothetical protein KAJ18_11095 [Candidatus Omnitrophica bacterium]|nr:hypothetical protein [Candidatus Omnitrophota bacterium]
METVSKHTEKGKQTIIEVLSFCQNHDFPARVVGKWVWIEFDSKPNTETRQALKDFGFRWSRRRGQWSHSCGHSSRPAHNYRPWDKYQTTSMADVLKAVAV